MNPFTKPAEGWKSSRASCASSSREPFLRAKADRNSAGVSRENGKKNSSSFNRSASGIFASTNSGCPAVNGTASVRRTKSQTVSVNASG